MRTARPSLPWTVPAMARRSTRRTRGGPSGSLGFGNGDARVTSSKYVSSEKALPTAVPVSGDDVIAQLPRRTISLPSGRVPHSDPSSNVKLPGPSPGRIVRNRVVVTPVGCAELTCHVPVRSSVSSEQSAAQPSPSFALPSSHASPVVRTPLPQLVGVQSESHPSPSVRLPSSQVSPASRIPFPHRALQSAEQPSPSVVLPSSQTSPAVTTPVPHAVGVQLESQPSPSVVLPSSQCSPGSSVPLPHVATAGNR